MRDVLERHGSLAVEFEHPIDHQKWIAMRQQAEKTIEVAVLLS